MNRFFMSVLLSLTLFSAIFSQIQADSIQTTQNLAAEIPQDGPVNCPAISYFLGTKSAGLGKTVRNYTGYCSNLDKTCCSYEDFKGIQNWWQEPTQTLALNQNQITISRAELRKQKQQNIYLFTTQILKYSSKILETAQKIQDDTSADEFCSSAATRVARHELPQNLLKNFQKEAEICWNFVNELQNSLMCSACDPEAQKWLNFSDPIDPSITITQDTFNKFSLNCQGMLKINLNNLYPYLRQIEHMARCDPNGRLSSKENILFPHSNIITAKIFNQIPIELGPKLINFGTSLNINTEGDEQY
jgi:hypothetical protein